MPLYDIEYVCPLTPNQQEDLAIALTDLHSTRFNTPRCFLNVRYTDASNQVVFRGGVRRKYNRVIMRTRAGENRSREMYIEHCRDVVAQWERIVGREGEEGLRTVWVMGALTTALEAGIARPKTGEEGEWLVANQRVFEARAQEGDEDFIELLREMESR